MQNNGFANEVKGKPEATTKIFKNGLTTDKVLKAKNLLDRVNISQICAKCGVKVSTIYNVLRDESPHIDQLAVVLKEAKKVLREKERQLKKLPI